MCATQVRTIPIWHISDQRVTPRLGNFLQLAVFFSDFDVEPGPGGGVGSGRGAGGGVDDLGAGDGQVDLGVADLGGRAGEDVLAEYGEGGAVAGLQGAAILLPVGAPSGAGGGRRAR